MFDIELGVAIFAAIFMPLVIVAEAGHTLYRWVRDHLNPDWRQVQ
jgi:hypothetical protein